MPLNGLARLRRGQVWCTECGKTYKVNPVGCVHNGWPKCCNQTMTIDSPEERGHQKDNSNDLQD